jgi:ferric-dicitrate binding protein FerR (iron transport regulator)
MDCERVAELLAAGIDGPIDVADATALASHLEMCPACRAVDHAIRADDTELRAAFAPHREAAERMATNVISELRISNAIKPAQRQVLPVLAAAAAGFLLAVMLLRPWATPTVAPHPVSATTAPISQPALATLALATGAVELRDAAGAWRAMPTGGSVGAGDVVRTGPSVRCEFTCPEGSLVRINEQTQLTFRQPRLLEVAMGQVWSTVAKAPEPFRVRIPQAEVTAVGTQFDVACSSANVATLTVVEGSTRVTDRSGAEKLVYSGEKLVISDGQSGAAAPVENLMIATRWVNEILVMKGRDDAELNRRIDELFADIGRSKMAYMYEDEIRALGDHCVVPLTRYISADTPGDEDYRRRTAARIVADVAQPWSAGELIRLLKDRDGEVRYHAARALQRVAPGVDSRTPEQWRDQSLMVCAPSSERWEKWWTENRKRFPATPPG